MTYSTLQTSTNQTPTNSPVANNYVAGDDVSVANRMADYYKAQGLDPKAAFDSPDDALHDFGPLI